MTTVPFHSRQSAAGIAFALRSDEHAPMSAMIEIADRCNETCVHCYQIQGQKGELETDDWKTILDELAEMGVLFLTISGGEATLRRDFLDLVAYARRKRFAVKIYTNGLSMTKALADRLGELAVQEVQISLYSITPEVHDRITCVPGSWTKTVAGARFLIAAGVHVVLKTPIMRTNHTEIEAYAQFVSDLGADYALDPHLDPREDGDTSPREMAIDDDAYLAARRHPRLAAGPHPVIERPLDSSVCGACSGNVHIEANGEMRPCTMLNVPVGHALRDGVRKAWETDERGKRIRGLTWDDLPGCRVCDLRSSCGRCFANANVEVGDPLAPYPGACHEARLSHELSHGSPPEIELTEGRDGSVGPYEKIAPGRFRTRAIPQDSAARAVWPSPAKLVELRRSR